MDKFIDKRLDGRYLIKALIGAGGMANVYKAVDDAVKDRRRERALARVARARHNRRGHAR